MFHSLRKFVPAQLKEQAVMIRRTFIERVPSERDGQCLCGQRPRYFSDSAVVIRSCSDAESVGESCSTGDDDWTGGSSDERVLYSDSSDNEYPLVQRSQDEATDAEGASPQLDGAFTWQHLRTMGFSDYDGDGDVAPSEHTPIAAVAPPAFFAPPDVSSASCLTQAVSPLQGQPQVVLGAEAQQLVLTSAQRLPIWAVIVPAPVGQCNTAALAPGTSTPVLSLNQVAHAPREEATAPTRAAAAAESDKPRGAPTPSRRTTLMARNVPNNYTQERFLALLDRVGLAGLYDFVYLPVDFRTGAALGYAFINMVDSSLAQRFWDALDGFHRWSLPSRKRCSVAWNDPHQGLDANVERYRNSPVMHPSVPDSYKPVVFSNGVRATYPAPTKALKAPRLPK